MKNKFPLLVFTKDPFPIHITFKIATLNFSIFLCVLCTYNHGCVYKGMWMSLHRKARVQSQMTYLDYFVHLFYEKHSFLKHENYIWISLYAQWACLNSGSLFPATEQLNSAIVIWNISGTQDQIFLYYVSPWSVYNHCYIYLFSLSIQSISLTW